MFLPLSFSVIFGIIQPTQSSNECLYVDATSLVGESALICSQHYGAEANWTIWMGLNACVMCTRDQWMDGEYIEARDETVYDQCPEIKPFICTGPPMYESDGVSSRVSYWKLLQPLQPVRGYKFGTIQLRRNMYLEFTFKYDGTHGSATEFYSIFRIGEFGTGEPWSCTRHGSRYPAFFIMDNTLQSTLSSDLTCWGNDETYKLLPDFNILPMVTYSIRMRYDTESVYLAASYANPSNNNTTIHEVIYNASYTTLDTMLNETLSVIIGDPVNFAAHVTIFDLLIISSHDVVNITIQDYLTTTQPSATDQDPTTTHQLTTTTTIPDSTTTMQDSTTTIPTTTVQDSTTTTPDSTTMQDSTTTIPTTTVQDSTTTIPDSTTTEIVTTKTEDTITTYLDRDKGIDNDQNDMVMVILIVSISLIAIMCVFIAIIGYRVASNAKGNFIVFMTEKDTNANETCNGTAITQTPDTAGDVAMGAVEEDKLSIVDQKVVKKEYCGEGYGKDEDIIQPYGATAGSGSGEDHDTTVVVDKYSATAGGECLECMDCGAVQAGKVYQENGQFYCFGCWANYEQQNGETAGYGDEGNSNYVNINVQTNRNTTNLQDLGDDFEIIGDDETQGQ